MWGAWRLWRGIRAPPMNGVLLCLLALGSGKPVPFTTSYHASLWGEGTAVPAKDSEI